ncbi:polysaccharide biosynthesis/export family protein [uncultured Roseivirga sp.]|uniref:polysaccharide biosynthesis/export family protein n=1 Tax=uncultured Roseivirga sp. TaxID=543088 RepID=UPI0030D896AE|tara:strand:- start:1301 stop:2116 length:816 start_codon:yes stop_codon:yes gene_type:complete
MVKKLLGLVVLIVVVSSCIPNEKIILFQNKNDNEALKLDTLITPPRSEYFLQPRDIISINFFSNVESVIEPFRQSTADVLATTGSGQQGGGQQGSRQSLGQTFVIDNNGYLLINTLEPLRATGLTTKVLKDSLESVIKKEKGIKDISVNVSLAGIRYTTTGEISGGQQVIAGSEANLLEAIANAGGFSINADRQKVQVLRNYEGGVKWHEIDVTQRDLMLTEFWYVKPGDIIYAPPLKLREIGAGDNFLSQLGVVVGLISTGIFLISLTSK